MVAARQHVEKDLDKLRDALAAEYADAGGRRSNNVTPPRQSGDDGV